MGARAHSAHREKRGKGKEGKAERRDKYSTFTQKGRPQGEREQEVREAKDCSLQSEKDQVRSFSGQEIRS